MMHFAWYDMVGTSGVLMVLVAYFLLQYAGIGYWWALLIVPIVVGATGVAVERLMGNKPEERFNFISARAEFVSEEGLDI